MSFITQLAARFPAMASSAAAISKPTKSLSVLGGEINALRFQYWYRYITTYGEVIGKATPQFRVVVGKILNPAEITYRELAVGTVCGIQIYGAFVVGEMWGRMSIVGYTPGKKTHH
ncbi:hypothetical protein AAMO2058_001528100 [Amorphochlora amoebiformis]